jgi:hypothetical protein
MDVGRHQCTQGSKHHPVTLERPQAPETFGDDAYTKMALTFPRTGMTCMEVTLINDLELDGVERALEEGANSRYARGARPHGRRGARPGALW